MLHISVSTCHFSARGEQTVWGCQGEEGVGLCNVGQCDTDNQRSCLCPQPPRKRSACSERHQMLTHSERSCTTVKDSITRCFQTSFKIRQISAALTLTQREGWFAGNMFLAIANAIRILSSIYRVDSIDKRGSINDSIFLFSLSEGSLYGRLGFNCSFASSESMPAALTVT